MPIYEYSCRECKKRSSILVLNPQHAGTVLCRHCGSSNLDRLLSRFASPKSEEARLESLADSANFGELDEADPRSVARLMEKMGQEMGEDVNDVEAMLDAANDPTATDHTDGV